VATGKDSREKRRKKKENQAVVKGDTKSQGIVKKRRFPWLAES
jgi:hypothetical protein